MTDSVLATVWLPAPMSAVASSVRRWSSFSTSGRLLFRRVEKMFSRSFLLGTLPDRSA
jgi:hypothetical protein